MCIVRETLEMIYNFINEYREIIRWDRVKMYSFIEKYLTLFRAAKIPNRISRGDSDAAELAKFIDHTVTVITKRLPNLIAVDYGFQLYADEHILPYFQHQENNSDSMFWEILASNSQN